MGFFNPSFSQVYMAARANQLCGSTLNPHVVPGFNSLTVVGFVGANPETR